MSVTIRMSVAGISIIYTCIYLLNIAVKLVLSSVEGFKFTIFAFSAKRRLNEKQTKFDYSFAY